MNRLRVDWARGVLVLWAAALASTDAAAQTAEARPLSEPSPPPEAQAASTAAASTDEAAAAPPAAAEAPPEATEAPPEDDAEEDEDAFAFVPPDTRIDYDVEIEGAPTEEIAGIVEQSLRLYRQQGDGAQSVAFLRRRAAGDVATVESILRSFGFYSGSARMRVVSPSNRDGFDARRAEQAEAALAAAEAQTEGDPPPQPDTAPGAPAAADDPAEPEDAEAEPKALVLVRITPGDAYTLARHDVVFGDAETVGEPPIETLQSYGSPVGEAAAAGPILDAEGAVVNDLRRNARPYARAEGRRAFANRERETLEIDTLVIAGPSYVYGPMTFEGAPDVKDAYLRTYIPWKEGEPVDVEALRQYQRSLMSTELFRAGRVELPEEPPEGDVAPVSVVLEQAPFNTFDVNLFYNTDEGVGGLIGYTHRNVFGSNEKLELQADTTIDNQIALARLSFPQYLRAGQRGVLQAQLRNINDDAFDERGGTISAGLERKLSPRWTVGGGALLEYSIINDTGLKDAEATLLGAPLFVEYDGSNDLLDPTDGQRLRFSLTPLAGNYLDDPVAFAQLDGSGSVYRAFDEERKYVAAGRLRLGSILGETLQAIPPTRRFYSGGGGSVRGYQKDFVGPVDFRNSPVGGRSVLEVNAELRARVLGAVSVVGFVDAGAVASEIVPTFDEGVQVAAGLGGRYASPVGPIRLDVAFPLNRRRFDNTFEFYISIGQAF
ncbi:MAG: BamA/TamA family outer membrane protein [Pseudomonadota bacterium]